MQPAVAAVTGAEACPGRALVERFRPLAAYLTEKFLPVWVYVRTPVIVLMAMILLSLLYYFTPNVRPGRFRLLTVGSSLALFVGFWLWWGFGLYMSTFGVRSAYGAYTSTSPSRS